MMVFGGSGDTSGFNLLQDVYKSCKKYNIINLKNMDEVKEHCLKLNMWYSGKEYSNSQECMWILSTCKAVIGRRIECRENLQQGNFNYVNINL